MKKSVAIYACLLLLIAYSCKDATNKVVTPKEESSAPEKTVSNEAVAIFDGKTFNGWHGYNTDKVNSAWQIDEDGAMYLDKSKGKGGDIITDKEYENFELSLEWKIADCGNSGIFWNVVESKELGAPYLSAAEMQVLDNKCHPDAKIVTHRAGDLYDMIETNVVNVKPAGEWNSIKIVTNDGDVQFWQNGANVVSFTMHTPEWDAMVAKSKFKDWAHFGKAKKGKIGLQDHNDMVWFRNITIKEL